MNRAEAVAALRATCTSCEIDWVDQATVEEPTVFGRVLLIREDGTLDGTPLQADTIHAQAIMYSAGYILFLPHILTWNYTTQPLIQLRCNLVTMWP